MFVNKFHPKNVDEGFVRLTFLNTEDEDDDWRSQALNRLPRKLNHYKIRVLH